MERTAPRFIRSPGVEMRNLRLLVAYDGTDYLGWQRQPQGETIQAVLEAVAARITGEPVKLIGSGRTDAGVHALGQVANFMTPNPIPCPNLMKALNGSLPSAIRILEASEAPAEFHSRYQANAKTYVYRILQSQVALPFISRYALHYPYPLNYQDMDQGARFLEGRHDFTSFAAAQDATEETVANGRRIEESSAVRTIYSSRIVRRLRTSMLVYRVRGDGFLRHMVRNIVGTLIEVGRGKLQPNEITRILATRDRSLAGPTAPAQGLCLVNVEYNRESQGEFNPRRRTVRSTNAVEQNM
jgi:tRNA pseudouridine38-40 synthase